MRGPTREVALAAVAAVLTLAPLTACTPSGGPTAPPSTTSAPPSNTPGQGDSMRERLAAGLRGASPARATLVEKSETSLTVVETPWLTSWQIIDVLNRTPPHPQRFFAALSAEGTAYVLTASPANFNTVTEAAGVTVDEEEVAKAVGQTFVDATQTFRAASYRVNSLDDVKWLPTLSGAQQSKKSEVEDAWADKVEEPVARRSGDGWQLVVWTVTGRELIRHMLVLTPGGAVTDQAEAVVDGLPVPESR